MSLKFNEKNNSYSESIRELKIKFEFSFLKHLTSITHENFDRNASNFKELDDLVDGSLNFKNFLSKTCFIPVVLIQIEDFKFV